jgi:hypothetical protein
MFYYVDQLHHVTFSLVGSVKNKAAANYIKLVVVSKK